MKLKNVPRHFNVKIKNLVFLRNLYPIWGFRIRKNRIEKNFWKKATLMSIQRNSINLSIIVVSRETKNSKYQGQSNKNLTFIDTK